MVGYFVKTFGCSDLLQTLWCEEFNVGMGWLENSNEVFVTRQRVV